MHEPNERLDAAARLRGTGWFLNPDTCRIEVEPEYVPHVGQHWITLEAALLLGKGDLYEGWKIWHRKKFADEQPERGEAPAE